MASGSRRGFSLIELLTVIAIIAVLAAILFPVFSRINENRRLASCMSNMHSIYVAANLYKDDQGAYPNTLFGLAEGQDGLPYIAGGSPLVPMGQVRRGALYPTYVKDTEKFHCPNNPSRRKDIIVTAVYPPSSAWSTLLPAGPTFTNGGMTFKGLPPAYDNQPVSFYAYDSYGISSSMDQNGRRVPNAGSTPGFFIVYSKDWTAARARGVDPRQDSPNQLLYQRSMPADRTVLAWCNYHVTSGAGDKCPVVYASGTTKPLDYRQVLRDGFNIGNN